jgi:hypothetical protein
MLADIGKSWCNSVNNNPKTVLDDKKMLADIRKCLTWSAHSSLTPSEF